MDASSKGSPFNFNAILQSPPNSLEGYFCIIKTKVANS